MLVIGNGESRKSINITNIKDLKVGCNAIMRDYNVDYLVCVDRRMVDEAINRKTNERSLIYTREEWHNSYKSLHKRIRPVPELPYVGSDRWDLPVHWGSGPYAVLLAAKLSKERSVDMVGFDLYGVENRVNNIYKDTPSYDSSTKKAVDPRYWIHQIGMVFQCFPKIKFTIYQTPGWNLPQAWNYPNVMVDKISNLV
jgi:hypothetical protein